MRRDIPVPSIAKEPVERTLFGETVIDDYDWIRHADRERVVAHLEAENAHTEAVLEPLAELRETLFDEIKSRVQETDLSVPVIDGDWAYYTRTEEGLAYPIHCRRPADAPEDGPEQVLLDENELAAASPSGFCDVRIFEVSPDHSTLIWGVDLTGDERMTLRITDLATGTELDDVLTDLAAGSAFCTDNRTFYYLRPDDQNRPHEVWRHRIGTDPTTDELVFSESDDRFHLGVGRDRDDAYVHIGCSSAVTDEVHLLDAADPGASPFVVAPRVQDVEYSVAHHDGRLVILTNLGAPTFRVVTADPAAPGADGWTDLVAADPEVTINDVDVFDTHLVLYERADGVTRMRVRWFDDGRIEPVDQPEPVSTVWSGINLDPAATTLRYGYTSMVTPPSLFELDLATGERRLLKQQEVLGGYDASLYETERLWATAEDGTRIPMSMVRRRDRPAEPGPVLLYAYGAYEISIDPAFSVARLSLLDRGFAFVIAHVRGGGEMGRQWYLDGKMEHKARTFSDTVACARSLAADGWCTPAQICLRGGSAGGLLVGAVLNLDPTCVGSAVAQVPFVDALNTMLDESLPLTAIEWEEWGNPAADAETYQRYRAFTPYENLRDDVDYPPIFALGGLHDTRVGYWEPAKWVARLRDETSGDGPVLLWTDLEAGHGGVTGRYDAWRDEARVLAFVIDAVDVA